MPPATPHPAASANIFSGIHAIAYAFFDADERLDRAVMRRQTDAVIAAGVDGVLALGLATEVSKLREAERRTVMDWLAEDNAGRRPLGFTIYGNSVAEQIDQIRHAEGVGANWVILQPPMVGAYAGIEYIRYFGRIADATSLPVAIQNAPAYMGRGLTAAEIRELTTQHPNVAAIKGEGSVVDIRAVIDATEGRVPVLNGRGGLELADNFRVGCSGMILAPDIVDHAVAVWSDMRNGDTASADHRYAAMLPSIVFVMQSIETLICYGKRLFAARTALSGQTQTQTQTLSPTLTVHDRAPALRPTSQALTLIAEHAARLGPFPQALTSGAGAPRGCWWARAGCGSAPEGAKIRIRAGWRRARRRRRQACAGCVWAPEGATRMRRMLVGIRRRKQESALGALTPSGVCRAVR